MITELKKIQIILQNQKKLLINLEHYVVPDALTLATRIEDIEFAEIDIGCIIETIQHSDKG